MITDFANQNYDSRRGTGVQVYAYQKYLGLQVINGAGVVSGSISHGENVTTANEALFTIVIASLGIATHAGVYYFKKKKNCVVS